MKIYVKSRWQHHPKGLGYFWQPANNLPTIIKRIESFNELISDHFCIMTLWVEYKTLQQIYYLHISGINSGYTDTYNRPIKHTVLWEGAKNFERQFRGIMLESVSGDLENKLKQMIRPDANKGFSYNAEDLSNIGFNHSYTSQTETDSVKENPFMIGTSSEKIDFGSSIKFKECLEKHSLPLFKRTDNYKDPVLLVAMGEGLTVNRLKNHKYLKWAFDSSRN